MAETPRCSLCDRPAIAYVRPLRRHLCEAHFIEYFEGRVRRILGRSGVRRGSKLLVALSGGKDSAAVLEALSALREEFGYELAAVHIDLGIGSFSRASREAAVREASKLGVPIVVVDLREAIGAGVPELARLSRRPPCSVCGLVKRYVLNAAAVEWGADYLVMGHNGDDILAYAFKAFIAQDLESLSKLGPYTESIPELAVGRLRPLYMLTAKEAFIYSFVKKAFFTIEECPNVDRRQSEFILKRIAGRLEADMPGFKIQLLGNLARRYRDYPQPKTPIRRCRVCGLLSSGEECSFCRLTRRILGEAMGPRMRSYIRRKLVEAGLEPVNRD